jgi:hypothetical protein
MLWFKKTRLEFAICAISTLTACGSVLAPPVGARSKDQQTASPSAVEKQVGAIKSIEGTTVTITTDSGSSAAVSVQPTTKIVRVAPGQTDLKTAVPVELKDLQVGDRVFVRWKASDTAQPVPALGIIVMKRADVDAKQEHDREDWQKRSVGGLVSSADPGSATVSISFTALGGTKTMAIHTTPKTVFRRYAPGSVKFDDAGPSSLDQIKPGDQLRALGTRNAEGSAMEAEEIVTGSFRNIAGTITSMDAASNSVTVMDLLTKKTVVVKLSSQSQLRKLSPEVAQRIAFRLKAAAGWNVTNRQHSRRARRCAFKRKPACWWRWGGIYSARCATGRRRAESRCRNRPPRRPSGPATNIESNACCSAHGFSEGRCGHGRFHGQREFRSYRNHAAGWRRTHIGGRPQRKPSDDSFALEPGFVCRGRRGRKSIEMLTNAVNHFSFQGNE